MSVDKRTENGDRPPRPHDPPRSRLSTAAGAVLRALGVGGGGEHGNPEERIKVLMKEGAEAGVFDEAERDMVRRVFRLGRQQAGALMTPMKKVIWLDIADPPEQMQRKVRDSPHSRFPVCEGSIDAILGVVQVKDLLIQSFTGKPFGVKGLLTIPLFIYEGTPGLKVLEMFKQTGTHIAVVLSEYGTVAGLLTLNDILEAIVGDMPTDVDSTRPSVSRRQDGSWLLDGMLPLEEFTDLLGLTGLPEGDYRTLAGFVVSRLGHIPLVSERFEWGGLSFEVADMDGHRVKEVVVAPGRGHSKV